jgi:hypothetical protein
MKRFFAFWVLCLPVVSGAFAVPFTFQKGQPFGLVFEAAEAGVVKSAAAMFAADYENVFGERIEPVGNPAKNIYIGTLGLGSEAERRLSATDRARLSGQWEAFVLFAGDDGTLTVVGSDKRGTAYGVLELSRAIGVSPWEWWADAVPAKKESVTLDENFHTFQQPSVKYRGIFLNDEDWGLLPWAMEHYPAELIDGVKLTDNPRWKGAIGPGAYERIFQLLLRLRANTLWPAMHECTVPFYFVEGNREAAERYGIVIGNSHCEPLARTSSTEWDVAGRGDYNYVTNRQGVIDYWSERLGELQNSENIFTIGMRGKHDGLMQGVRGLEEHRAALSRIIPDQRELLARYMNPDVTKVPQAFIPYKEVLEVYNSGLEVPQDVTLMWCDDNYGYIRHLPTEAERARPGGNGVYYHVSYWGRPHDYLGLASVHPALVYTQMKKAYDAGARQMWILNVGDIKPAEYPIELFMDMGWNIDAIEDSRAGLQRHLTDWLAREFGPAAAWAIRPVLDEHYRLAYIRKPEHMGGTRVEESDRKWTQIADLPWTEQEIETRLVQYAALETQLEAISKNIAETAYPAWLQLVEYPVQGAVEMNRKHLYGQLARHGMREWEYSDAAYDRIEALTAKYNSLNDGKWHGMMDYRPRNLAVYDRVPRVEATAPMPEPQSWDAAMDGEDYDAFTGERPVAHGLGYNGLAVSVVRGSSVTYRIESGLTGTDSVAVELALAPNHPTGGQTLRYAVSVDGGEPQEVDYRTWDRSEEWKLNVLRNRAIRTTRHHLNGNGPHTLTITALDDGVILDQIKIRLTK